MLKIDLVFRTYVRLSYPRALKQCGVKCSVNDFTLYKSQVLPHSKPDAHPVRPLLGQGIRAGRSRLCPFKVRKERGATP